jgi:hypothetical protein
MDPIFNQLMHEGVLIAAILVVMLTFFIRQILETQWPSLKGVESTTGTTYPNRLSLWYCTLFLYMIPVILGAGIAVLGQKVTFILPEGVTTLGGAILWGSTVGWLSSFIYKVIRKIFKEKFGVDLTPGPISFTKLLKEADTKDKIEGRDDEHKPDEKHGEGREDHKPDGPEHDEGHKP